MRLIAATRLPAQLDPLIKPVAEALGLSAAEVRMRLAAGAPAILAPAADADAGPRVSELRRLGVPSLSIDFKVPRDRDRLVANRFAVGAGGLQLASRGGQTLSLGWPEVLAVLRGARESRTEVERTETRYSLGGSALGIPQVEVEQRTERSTSRSSEQVLLIYGRRDQRVVMAEGMLDFRCLGKAMQPSSAGNMAELARAIKEKAPGAFHDERLMRLGRRPLPFVIGGESIVVTSQVAVTKSDTSASLDALAEVMHQALLQGLPL